MSVASGPDGIVEGLICALDPSNPKCYPGSGTVLYDLSGTGNHGTLVNGPTWSSANQGVIVLDGTNDYIDVPINLSTSNYTVIGAARYLVASGRTFSAKNNNWLMGHWSTQTENYYAQSWVTAPNAGPSDTSWRFYAATGNYSGDLWSLYVNGVGTTVNSTAGTNGPNGFAIGSSGGVGEFSNSHIGVFMVYNRVLTQNEISTSFRSLRSRYSL